MSENQKKDIWYWAIIIASILGVIVSTYLTYVHFQVHADDTAYASLCNINADFNCDTVAASEWSLLFGVPVSIWGILFYLFYALFAVFKLITKKLPNLSVYFSWAGFFGIVFSLFLAYISKAVLDTWCLFCMASWSLTLLLFIFSLFCLSLPFIKHVLVFKYDFVWFFSRPSRIIITVITLAIFCSGVGYLWNKELKRLEIIRQNAPRFKELKTPIKLKGHHYGSDNPLLTIIEFSDYQCPHCSVLYKELKKISNEFKQEIKVIHKDYPMDNQCNPALKKPFHKFACKAAMFVRCAEKQDQYWQASDLVFENQKRLKDPEIFDEMTDQLKLDKIALDFCLNDPEVKHSLFLEIKEGLRHKFRGTPIIIFDGKKQLVSNWSQGRLQKVIKNYIKGKKRLKQ